MASLAEPDVMIPRAENGMPLVDLRAVDEALGRFPGLRMSFDEFLSLGDGFHGDWIDGRVEIRGGQDVAHHEALSLLSTALRWFEEKDEPRAGEGLCWFVMRPAPGMPARLVDYFFLAREHAGRLKHVFLDGPADLVVEVVDNESRQRDTVEKFREYEQGGIREYWIVDPVRREARAWRLRNGRYEPMPEGDPPMLRSEVLPGLWIDPTWIWERRKSLEIVREWGLI